MSISRRLILVTGCPRSGTTPLGKGLALAPGTVSLYEPLNATVGDRRVSRYFELPGDEEFAVSQAEELFDAIRRLRLSLPLGIFARDPLWRRAVKVFTGSQTRFSYRRARFSRAPVLIWKDPFAVFWTRMLAQHHPDVDIVATYRPVLAVAASFARLGWGFDVLDLADRLERTTGSLHPEVDSFLGHADLRSSAANGAAVWALAYQWLAERPGDLTAAVDTASFSSDSEQQAALFRTLGLQWSETVASTLRPAARRRDAPDFGTRAHSRDRNIETVNTYYRRVLSQQDVEMIGHAFGGMEQRVTASLGLRHLPKSSP
jgi:hypothetical protein